MQIDELPAGEQTQNPDLDMNQVVGTHDILMLCFDTLRYDVSKEEEEAGRTPVLNSHGGEWEKRHAPGNFTYPCLLYTSPSPRATRASRMKSSD